MAEGVPHHITQRGNNRQDVFLVDEDRRFYLDTLAEDCRRCGVGVLGYCLMTNHVHLVAVPERADSFARALRRSHSRYAQRFNRQYGRSGHLWQNRFFSCPLGRDHLLTALFYVDQNPLRAGSVGQAGGVGGVQGRSPNLGLNLPCDNSVGTCTDLYGTVTLTGFRLDDC